MKTQGTRKTRGLTASMYDFKKSSHSVNPTHNWASVGVFIVAIPLLLTVLFIVRHVAAG